MVNLHKFTFFVNNDGFLSLTSYDYLQFNVCLKLTLKQLSKDKQGKFSNILTAIL